MPVQQFADVAPDNAFYPYIDCLVGQDILSGYPCGEPGEPCDSQNLPYFRPGSNVTRGQLAKIVSNAAGYNDDPGALNYTDVDPTSTFYDYIQRLTIHNVISGYQCGGPGEPCDAESRPYFRPGASATRGQIAKIVSNAANYQENHSQQTFAARATRLHLLPIHPKAIEPEHSRRLSVWWSGRAL